MIHIYVTEKALEKMALLKRWSKILSCRDIKDIYMYASEDDLAKYDLYDAYESLPIPQLINDGSIHLMAKKEQIDEIKSDYSKVLEDPSAIYFLDIDPSVASDIQSKYGVICKNENDIDDNELSDWGEAVCCNGELDHNWREFLYKIKKSPTNTIIVNDRYLFKYDERSVDGKRPGFDNILSILDAILPDTFDKQKKYHVLIVYSEKGDKNSLLCKIPFKDMAKQLSEKINVLRKGKYRIQVELLCVDFNYFGYDFTHNRRVITNYHIIRAEHKLTAFKNNKSTCNQTLNWDSLFSKGLTKGCDIPYKNLKILLSNIQDINNFGKANPENSTYKYGIDGACPKSEKDKDKIIFSEIKNRLINKL